MKYVLSSDIGEIKVNNKGKQLKKVIIQGKEYPYNPSKPFTERLTKKLDKISKTPEYKRFKILNDASKKVMVRQALKSYAIKNKASITDEQSALKSYANSYSISNINLSGFKGLSYLKYQKERLNDYLKKHKSMKVLITVDLIFEHADEEEEVSHTIGSRRYNILNEEDLNNAINNMASDIELLVENKNLKKSGLKVKKVNKITIHYDKYDPTRAGKFIELPDWIAKKKACINIKNDDDFCLKYCILCRFYDIYKKDHPERLFHYAKLIDNESLIKWDGVNFPASNEDIQHFEEINNNTFSVNVYTVDNDNNKIRVDRVTTIVKPNCHVNLLRLDNDDGSSHYVYIKDYSRLMGSQTNKTTNRMFHCRFCQKGFKHERLLTAHTIKGCMANNVQAIEMPEEKEKMCFQKHYKKLTCPYVIYGDFECLTTLSSEGLKGVYTELSNPLKGAYQNHIPSGFMLNVVNSITDEVKPYIYRGEDCMDKFCETMNEIREEIFEKMKTPKTMIITHEQEK